MAYLKGAVEGTIRWTGAVPGPLTTACGIVPTIRVARDHSLAGAIVWITTAAVGRQVTGDEERTLLVGGTVIKHGCAFVPSTQVMAPVPSAFTVHNDAQTTRVRISREVGEPAVVELQPAARTAMAVEAPAVTRIDGADGTLGAAYVVGLSTYYYAITDERGHFRIDELAPGAYELTAWHPPIPKLVAGMLVYGKPITIKRRFTVPKTGSARVDLALSR